MCHRGHTVTPSAIRRVPLMTVEGEKDDITGIGQTAAAHDLCKNLPSSMKRHHLQLGAGHYGVFNGARFRAEIVPKINDVHRGQPPWPGPFVTIFWPKSLSESPPTPKSLCYCRGPPN